MYLNCLLLGGLSAAPIVAARRLRGTTVLADAFFPLALLHWGQHQNLLWDFGLQFICSTVFAVALLIAIVSVRGARVRARALSSASACSGSPCAGRTACSWSPCPRPG